MKEKKKAFGLASSKLKKREYREEAKEEGKQMGCWFCLKERNGGLLGDRRDERVSVSFFIIIFACQKEGKESLL